jgi:hypothetical protein
MFRVFFIAALLIDTTIMKVIEVTNEKSLILAMYKDQRKMVNRQKLNSVTMFLYINLIL